MMAQDIIHEPIRQTPVVAHADVLVVGGGPAGLCAAIAAARNGARVILTERYGHLGGLASGGEVIVLDDMADLTQKTVAGLRYEFVERLDALGAAVYPLQEDQFVSSEDAWARWGRWGLQDNYARTQPKTITYAVAFDPEAFKFVALAMLEAAGVELRLHSTFADAIVEGSALDGAIFETKAGRQAILANVVVDASGDGDVFARCGADFELTKQDVLTGRWFADRIGRGRDYYYPYRTLLPVGIENLLVAGRCFSATSEAQKMSREIPPMMVIGEAAGVAAALALRERITPRQVSVSQLQELLRAQGANLGPDRDPCLRANRCPN